MMRLLFNEVSSTIRRDLIDTLEKAITFAEYDDDFEYAVRDLMCDLILNLSEEEGKRFSRDIEYIETYINHFCVSRSRTYDVFQRFLIENRRSR